MYMKISYKFHRIPDTVPCYSESLRLAGTILVYAPFSRIRFAENKKRVGLPFNPYNLCNTLPSTYAFNCLIYLEHGEVRKKTKTSNRYNQVPHLTQDTIWESDKNTRKHHIQESQEVNPFPDKAAWHSQDTMAKTNIK